MASRAGILLLALASVQSVASAEDLLFSMNSLADWQRPYTMQLALSAPDGGVVPLTYDVVPLTMQAGLNQTDTGREAVSFKGNLVWATMTNYINITSSDSIAYLCCDNMDMDSTFITPSRMLDTLMSNRPKAILLYSTQGNCCGIQDDLRFRSIFTMTDSGEAADALRTINATDDGVVQATITGNSTSAQQDDQDNQGGSNSAVAMSILYSITGLITLLFLIIIATGAIRAHRYPERYGPRSGYGSRPRQSRAKGLARAVLETIPIIKFGAPPPAKEDPSLELESAQPSIRPPQDPAMGTRLSAIPEEPQRSPVNAGSAPGATPDAANGSNRPQAVTENTSQKGQDEHLGCSICTEDFKVGEDVRVLPCDHKFHPPCIDPWLINVSGTCPLCRLDLRPSNAGSDNATGVDDAMQLPPPLEVEGSDIGPQNLQRNRRSSRLLDLHRLRHASVEERIEILRRHRSQQQETGQGADHEGESAERHHRARLADRLRDKFRIRTRTQSPGRTSPSPGASTS